MNNKMVDEIDLINNRIKELGITPCKLAKINMLDASSMYGYLSKESVPKYTTIKRMLSSIGINIDYKNIDGIGKYKDEFDLIRKKMNKFDISQKYIASYCKIDRPRLSKILRFPSYQNINYKLMKNMLDAVDIEIIYEVNNNDCKKED